jgi:hypothetical protein
MQAMISESTNNLTDRLAQSCRIIELLKFELAQEKECYSAYYLDLFLNSNKDGMHAEKQLKAALAELNDDVMMLKSLLSRAEIDKFKLVEQNASLWKIIFSLLKNDTQKSKRINRS